MKSILKTLLLGICISFVSISLSGQLRNNSVTNQVQRSILDEGLNQIKVTYQINGIQSFNKVVENKNYVHLSIKDFGHTAEVGKPAIPSHIEYIAIPEGATYQLHINSKQSRVENTARVYPALQPARDTEGAPEPSFEIDAETYQTNAYYPAQPVEIVEIVKIRGMRMAAVRVQPIQYNPVEGKIKIHSEIEYTIRFQGGQRFVNPASHSQHYMNIIERYPLNGGSIKAEYAQTKSNSSATSTPNYLIVTHDDYQAAADSLAKWKTQLGYTVEIISSNSWISDDVKQAIHSRYDNYTPKPDYFVIIGDHDKVPAKMLVNSQGDDFGSDLYYACMDGNSDYVADMARGRISVSSTSEATMVVEKIIKYEKHPVQDSNFYTHGINCAQYQDDDQNSEADRRFTHTSEDIRNYVMSQGYEVRRIYYTDNNVYPAYYNSGYYSNGQAIPNELLKSNGFSWNGNSTHIKNAVDSGRFYLFHRDHGFAGGSGWAHPYFVKSKVNQLANGDKLPVVFSINCHTGEFTLPSCFSETFLRKQGGGAVGVFGASYYSYSGYNDGLSIGFIDGIWSNPGIVPQFGNGGISNPNVTAHSDIIHMGDVLNHGLIRVAQTWGGGAEARKYTNELFHYFGDPAMRIWTEKPDSIIATFAAQINCDDTALHIQTVNQDDVLAVLVGNGVILGKTVISNGSGYLPINSVQGNLLTLTLSKRNCVPQVAQISVAAGGSLALFTNIKHNACYGDSTASIEVIPSCGFPPYNVQWSTGQSSSRIDSLGAGTYIVTVSDLNTTIVDTFTIQQPQSGVSATAVTSDAKCNFQSSGSIDLTVSGGTAPYIFDWSNGQSVEDAINLPANNYSVTITDANNCETTYDYVIQQPAAIDIATSFTSDTNSQCIGTATAAISGGTLPYDITWNDPSAQTSSIITGLCAGLYKVTVIDSNQCTRYRTVYVDNYSDVSLNDLDEDASISVFPNPSKGIFTLRMEEGFQAQSIIEIYDAQAKLIYKKEISEVGANEIQIDIQNHASGLYHLRIYNGTNQKIYTKDIIVE